MKVIIYWMPIIGLFFLLKDSKKTDGGFYDPKYYVGKIAPLYVLYQAYSIGIFLVLITELITYK